MYICKVTGRLVSTLKNEKLTGCSMVMVSPVYIDEEGNEMTCEEIYAAVDPIGCSEGNLVIVTEGSNASYIFRDSNIPIDMAIVGILDKGLPK